MRHTFEQHELFVVHVSPRGAHIELLSVHAAAGAARAGVAAARDAGGAAPSGDGAGLGGGAGRGRRVAVERAAPRAPRLASRPPRSTCIAAWSAAALRAARRPGRSDPSSSRCRRCRSRPSGRTSRPGRSHLPFTQLSVQQSVLRVHVWWNDRQVRQLTPGRQVLPEQQPLEHDVAVHWQLPPTHTCPVAHAGPPPQEHLPLVQPSARVELQVVHALPPEPQFVTDVGDSQVPPLQQPEVHVCAQPWQTLLTQLLPGRTSRRHCRWTHTRCPGCPASTRCPGSSRRGSSTRCRRTRRRRRPGRPRRPRPSRTCRCRPSTCPSWSRRRCCTSLRRYRTWPGSSGCTRCRSSTRSDRTWRRRGTPRRCTVVRSRTPRRRRTRSLPRCIRQPRWCCRSYTRCRPRRRPSRRQTRRSCRCSSPSRTTSRRTCTRRPRSAVRRRTPRRRRTRSYRWRSMSRREPDRTRRRPRRLRRPAP